MSVNSFRDDEDQKVALKKDTIIRLLRYLLDYKKQIITVLFIMGAGIAVALINPIIIERALNVEVAGNIGSETKDYSGLLILGAVAVVINILRVVSARIRMTVMARLSNNVLKTIREQLYSHIQTLGFKFFDSRPNGKVLARITGDVNSLKEVLTDGVTTLIPELLTLIAVMVIMVIKNYVLALAVLVTIPFLAGGMFFLEIKSHKGWQNYRKKGSNLNAFLHEDFSGIRVVQSFSAEEETTADFQKLNGDFRDAFDGAVRWSDAFGPIIDIMWAVGTLLLYWAAVYILDIRVQGIGTIVAFSSYLSMFWGPIRNLGNYYNKLVTNISAAERIFEILDTQPEIVDGEKVYPIPKIKGAVEFSNVSFCYEDGKNVLSNVSFKVRPGETIALVGPTGAGKTTIVNLISRFYDIQQGDILIDGHSVKNVTISSLRGQMGIMTQDSFVFSGTVRENIRYGRLDASDGDIINAAIATGAHEFISKLEKGYDTELTEHGSELSIGQRQLIAFARTMVSKPGILILDEATSSIDTHTELLVQKGIAAMLSGRTSFVVAHRLSTIKNADRIFVIDNGKICEQGSHEELIAKNGAYSELYKAQFRSLRSAV